MNEPVCCLIAPSKKWWEKSAEAGRRPYDTGHTSDSGRKILRNKFEYRAIAKANCDGHPQRAQGENPHRGAGKENCHDCRERKDKGENSLTAHFVREYATNWPQWKKDFPIEWEGDHYVSRREMVKFLTLGSSILAAANWLVAWIWHRHRAETFTAQMIGSVTDLERSKSMLFRYPTERDPCIAVCMPTGELVAYSQVCTHLSCAVIYKEEELFCPCHNGVFELKAGRPTAGPPTRPLPRIVLEKRGDQLFATGVEVTA